MTQSTSTSFNSYRYTILLFINISYLGQQAMLKSRKRVIMVGKRKHILIFISAEKKMNSLVISSLITKKNSSEEIVKMCSPASLTEWKNKKTNDKKPNSDNEVTHPTVHSTLKFQSSICNINWKWANYKHDINLIDWARIH